ncbi:hypothetical protein ALC57_11787 [Trachymyrmex cornetzi]|uniref:Uncharacterized protein n=1 Tax=Trachymyrmex cornetzi TaxID=471704 RepID=A0A151J1V9_9HYME|nr:hypothetical protein ALC57_11787 [Trachymyrmex cornetzi]
MVMYNITVTNVRFAGAAPVSKSNPRKAAPASRRIRRTPRVEITAKLVLAEKINWKLCTLRHPI